MSSSTARTPRPIARSSATSFRFTHVDVGGGWLIFGLPPAEVAVHPSDGDDGAHELYLMCNDVERFRTELSRHGIATSPPANRGWGVLTEVTLPGGGKLGVYQPRHARPEPVSAGDSPREARAQAADRQAAGPQQGGRPPTRRDPAARQAAGEQAARQTPVGRGPERPRVRDARLAERPPSGSSSNRMGLDSVRSTDGCGGKRGRVASWPSVLSNDVGRTRILSHGRDVVAASPSTTAPAAGRHVIATVGIDRYRHWRALSNAVGDAVGATALFRQLGFEQVVPPLLDERATGDAIDALVTDELTGLTADDSLVVFYAGHGGTRTQRVGGREVRTGYLIPVDGDPSRAASWIEIDPWLCRISKLPPRHILVILDACFSGIALSSAIKWGRNSGALLDLPFAAANARQSRLVITSALDDEQAMDSGPMPGHSLFTGCLIEALTGGVSPVGMRDGRHVTIGSEIGRYVRHRVQTYPGRPGWRQTPDLGTFDFDERGEMLIPVLIGDGDAAAPAKLARGSAERIAARPKPAGATASAESPLPEVLAVEASAVDTMALELAAIEAAAIGAMAVEAEPAATMVEAEAAAAGSAATAIEATAAEAEAIMIETVAVEAEPAATVVEAMPAEAEPAAIMIETVVVEAEPVATVVEAMAVETGPAATAVEDRRDRIEREPASASRSAAGSSRGRRWLRRFAAGLAPVLVGIAVAIVARDSVGIGELSPRDGMTLASPAASAPAPERPAAPSLDAAANSAGPPGQMAAKAAVGLARSVPPSEPPVGPSTEPDAASSTTSVHERMLLVDPATSAPAPEPSPSAGSARSSGSAISALASELPASGGSARSSGSATSVPAPGAPAAAPIAPVPRDDAAERTAKKPAVDPPTSAPGSATNGPGVAPALQRPRSSLPARVAAAPAQSPICPLRIEAPRGAEVLWPGGHATVPAELPLRCDLELMLTIRKPHFVTTVMTVTPTPGAKPIRARLPKQTIPVSITSTPAGATIEIAGRDAGHTPCTLKLAEFEASTLTFDKDGYVSRVQRINPSVDGSTLQVALTAAPAPR